MACDTMAVNLTEGQRHWLEDHPNFIGDVEAVTGAKVWRTAASRQEKTACSKAVWLKGRLSLGAHGV